MTENEAIKLFKCLSDKSRLQILKSLSIQDMYVELLAERLDLSPSTISFHLKKLFEVGAVESYKNQYYTMYSIREDVFNTTILDVINETITDTQIQNQREEEYRQRVINAFFEYGKLKVIPAQRKKKRIILEEIAKSFKPEKTYSEREVNMIIADFHDDFCTIRREMIGEKIMEREKNQYKLITK